MFKHALFIIFFALFAVFASAAEAPPACFLACVNEEPKVSDIKAVCNSKDMQDCFSEKCSESALKPAINHFQATCKENGHTAYLVSDSKKPTNGTSSSNSTSSGSGSSGTGSGNSDSGNDEVADSGASLPTANIFGIFGAFVVGILCIVV